MKGDPVEFIRKSAEIWGLWKRVELTEDEINGAIGGLARDWKDHSPDHVAAYLDSYWTHHR